MFPDAVAEQDRPPAPLLRLQGVVKRFGRLRALDGLDLDVCAGEILGVVGPNGAGKSTVFNVVTRVPFGQDGGAIIFDGHELPRRARAICRLGVARTFQHETTFGDMSVRDTLRVAATFGHGQGTRAQRAKTIAEVIERCNLGAVLDRAADGLRLLDKRQLMLASALVTRPRLLLLDEPASGLNPQEHAELASTVRHLRETGVTVIVIEHILPLLMSVADRLAVMAAGQLVAEGPPGEVVKLPEVVEAYLGTTEAAA